LGYIWKIGGGQSTSLIFFTTSRKFHGKVWEITSRTDKAGFIQSIPPFFENWTCSKREKNKTNVDILNEREKNKDDWDLLTGTPPNGQLEHFPSSTSVGKNNKKKKTEPEFISR